MKGFILGQNAGINISTSTPAFLISTTTSTTNVLIATVNGSGIITSISQGMYTSNTGNAIGYLTLVIDGTTVYNDIPYSNEYMIGGYTSSNDGFCITGNAIAGIHKFNTSFSIYHRTSYAPTTVKTHCAYLLR